MHRQKIRLFGSLVKTFIFLFIVIIILLAAVYYSAGITGMDLKSPVYLYYSEIKQVSENGDAKKTVIIDPGHGGIDSGTVGVGGTLEKDLNLTVSKKIGAFLEHYGFNVIYTREDDRMLNAEGAKRKKLSDVTERVKFASNHDDAYFVSIHMNSNLAASCKGAQVYFSKNDPESELIANSIYSGIVASLQNGNKREPKAAGSNIFILDRIESPAILIECGFLSNAEEEKMLCDEAYQNKLALIIADSIYKYYII